MKNGNVSDTSARNENSRNGNGDNNSSAQNMRTSGIRLSWSWLFRICILMFTAGLVLGMWGWEKLTQEETAKIRSEMLEDMQSGENIHPTKESSFTNPDDALSYPSSTTTSVTKAVGVSRAKAMEYMDVDSPKKDTAPEKNIETSMIDMFDDFVKSAQAGIARFLGNAPDNSSMDGRRVTQVTADFNVRTSHKLTAKAINSVLGGVLKGKGELFIEAGKKYGISPAFLAGISIHECDNGKSRQARELNNVMGVMADKTPKKFDSIEECVNYMASRLKKSPCYKTSKTIAQFQKVYCPVGAANDPTKLNKYWKEGVVDKMNKILEKDMLLASNTK